MLSLYVIGCGGIGGHLLSHLLESLASLDCADEGIKCYALDGDCIRILIYKFSVERDFVEKQKFFCVLF